MREVVKEAAAVEIATPRARAGGVLARGALVPPDDLAEVLEPRRGLDGPPRRVPQQRDAAAGASAPARSPRPPPASETNETPRRPRPRRPRGRRAGSPRPFRRAPLPREAARRCARASAGAGSTAMTRPTRRCRRTDSCPVPAARSSTVLAVVRPRCVRDPIDGRCRIARSASLVRLGDAGERRRGARIDGHTVTVAGLPGPLDPPPPGVLAACRHPGRASSPTDRPQTGRSVRPPPWRTSRSA